MSRTLYIDVDSTIWPAEVEYEKAAQELFGMPFGSDQWYSVDELEARFGPEFQQLFAYALDPTRIPFRKLYPHAKRSLRLLAHIGFHLHFISHNNSSYHGGIHDWLTDLLGDMEFDLTVQPVMEMDKVDFMTYDPHAWGIMEDKPSTLVSAAEMGYVTIAKRQPWNTLTIVQRSDILSFDSWLEVPSLIGRRLELGSAVV